VRLGLVLACRSQGADTAPHKMVHWTSTASVGDEEVGVCHLSGVWNLNDFPVKEAPPVSFSLLCRAQTLTLKGLNTNAPIPNLSPLTSVWVWLMTLSGQYEGQLVVTRP
jgi:hypothetical protein